MDKKITVHQFNKLDKYEYTKNVVFERDETGSLNMVVIDKIENTKIKILFIDESQVINFINDFKKFAEDPDNQGSDPDTWRVKY